MKHKLINAKTGKEHLCDKIVIDGFDYYVSGEKPIKACIFYVDDVNQIRQAVVDDEEYWDKRLGYKTVIASNNPNSDTPKVLDEIEMLAKQNGFDWENTETSARRVFKKWYKSQETHPFSEEDMMNLIEWMQTPAYLLNIIDSSTIKSTQELLQLWKEQQSKIIYYVD